jgi:hypothetical protein
MSIELRTSVPQDGSVALSWRASDSRPSSWTLLVIRTGSVPAYTAWNLSGDIDSYQINNLSRHQRYRIAVAGGDAISPWVDVTPRVNLEPKPDEEIEGVRPYVAGIERVTVMPQDARLTAYWKTTSGFVDKVVIEVLQGGQVWKQLEVPPEVTSLSLDKHRGVPLMNGRTYGIRLHTVFGGVNHSSETIRCTTAPQGQEREANRGFPQDSLIYASLALTPEVKIFDDEDDAPVQERAPAAQIVCFQCRQTVEWDSYRLVCRGCGAEFIPNGRGDFLDVGRLRFGTCKCCLPKKILVQRPGSQALTCAHSGKEHIRFPGAEGYHLIEDLPYGLCQCCRPRRPLVKRGQKICCSKSGEKHKNENGSWVLVPSDPVFDAAAIDDLLDAGLADICSTGVSRGAQRRRS